MRLYYQYRRGFDLQKMATVYSGPFSGMSLCSTGSWGGHGARLLGTYEKELNNVVSVIPSLQIEHIIDVGCADGYYSCGFAFKYPSVHVTAYDLSRHARWCTYSAARANKLLSRVSIYKFFDVKKYQSRLDRRELLFLDCEGFEIEIITAETVSNFSNAAIIVECHDFLIPNTTESLSEILQGSHDIEFIQTRDRMFSDIPANLPNTKSVLDDMQEHRPAVMTWIWAIPKSWKTSV